MRKTWFYLMCCITFILTSSVFTSCSDDDEEGDITGSIIGTWQSDEEDYIETITFNSNGTFTVSAKEYDDGEWFTIISESGTYTYANNIITIKGNEINAYLKVKSVTSTSLTLEMEDEEDGSYYVIYKKV